MYLLGVFLCFSIEFTSFHLLFTLVFIFLALVNSTEDGHICRPLQIERFFIIIIIIIFFYHLENESFLGSQRGLKVKENGG